MNIVKKIITFLKEVKVELKKVTWPTKQEATKHTIVVIAVSIVAAAFLGGIDFLFSYLIDKFII
jgi:preprotein translocase subunit SecE